MVETIKQLVVGADKEMDKLSTLLKQDVVIATDCSDVDFINKVIVPILHAEERVPITLSILDKSQKEQSIQPIFAGSEANASKDTFFLKTDILNKK